MTFIKALTLSLALLGVLISSIPFAVSAQPTYTINYQGKLTDTSGLAVPDGTYNMRFWLLQTDVQATTSAVWTETRTGADKVTVTNGLFSVMLGEVSSLASVNFNQTLYLGVEVGGSGSVTWDGEMLPRKQLGTVPSAFEAKQLGGVASSSFLRSDAADTASGLLTFTGGFITSASSSISDLTTLTATTTNFVINGERFTDLTGTGLQNSSGILSVNISALNAFFASTTDFDTSAELAAILTDETGTAGSVVFSESPTIQGGATIGGGEFTLGTAGVKLSTDGDGAITFLGLGNGTDENLIMNLDDSSNTVAFTTGTGVSVLTFSMGLDSASYVDSNGYRVDGTLIYDANLTSDSYMIGESVGGSLPNGATYNVLIGYQTAQNASSTAFDDNVAIGYQAGRNTTGGLNTIIGSNAGASDYLGNSNSILGAFAGGSAGSGNTLLGIYAGVSVGDNNVAVGDSTLLYNGSDNNTAIGQSAGWYSSGANNNFIGYNAGGGDADFGGFSYFWNNTGDYNDFMGYEAGRFATGDYNQAMGYQSSKWLMGTGTVAIGAQTLYGDNSGGTEARYTAINNVALGYRAGYNATNSADNNILIGYQAADNLTTGNNNIIIGYDIDSPTATADNRLIIGNIIYGNGIDATGTTVDADATIGIGTSTPWKRFSVAGDVHFTGALFDSSGDAGTNGQVLLSTGTGMNWVATSSLGISSGVSFSDSAGLAALLSDETGSGVAVFGTSPTIATPIFTTSADFGTAGVRISDDGDGAITFLGMGNGSDENLIMNLDDTSNTIAFTTGTGVTVNTFSMALDSASYIDSNGYRVDGTLIYDANLTNDSIMIGEGAGASLSNSAVFNVAIGYMAAAGATSSANDYNVSIGMLAGGDSAGFANTYVGAGYDDGFSAYYTGYNSYGNGNSFFGSGAGQNNSGDYNTAIGYLAGGGDFAQLKGSQNNIIGISAGSNLAGSFNNIMGNSAGAGFGFGNDALGSYNNILGYYAGSRNDGDYNNIFGYQAGMNNRSDFNEFVGYQTAKYLNATTSVAIGAQALYGDNSGGTEARYTAINNVAIGYRAGYNATNTANNNILIGYQAADNLTTGNNNIIIGYDIDAISATADNKLNIGNLLFGTGLDGTGTTLASGNIGIGTTTPAAKLNVYGDMLVTEKVAIGSLAQYGLTGPNDMVNISSAVSDIDIDPYVALNVSNYLSPNATPYDNVTAIDGEITTSAGVNYTAAVSGVAASVSHAGTGTVSYAVGVSSYVGVTDEGTTTDAFGLTTNIYAMNAGHIEDAYGLYVYAPSTASLGTITNSYGVYVENQGATEYNIYSAGATSRNLFEGSFDLGTAGVRLTNDGDGAITFLGMGNGSDEDLTLNLDDTANTGVFTSSTGLNILNFSAITLQESGSNVLSVGDLDTCAEFAALGSIETGTCGTVVLSTSPTITTPRIATIYGGTAASSQLTLVSTTGAGTTDDIIMQIGNNGGTQAFRIDNENNSIAFGEFAGATFTANTTYNVAVGYEAGRYSSTTNADYNTLLGYRAGARTTGSYTFSGGWQAGEDNTGYSNVLIGYSAGNDNAGDYVVAIGEYAGLANPSAGDYNVFLGYYAGRSNTGYRNNIIGADAGWTQDGDYNNILGSEAGYENTGSYNILIGQQTGFSNTGSSSVMIGHGAGYANSGDYNELIGFYAGSDNSGDYNQMIGYCAGCFLNASATVALGAEALYGDNSGGTERLYTAINNVAIGYRAGYNATNTANNNILIGYQAADNLTTGNNNIIIGYNIDSPTATVDNILNIGNIIYGSGIDATGTTVDANATIGIGTSTPWKRFSVAGDVHFTGALFDSSGDAGTNGMVLLSTNTGTNWVATSSLGIGGGSLAMGSSITSASQGSVLFAGASGVLAQDNANFKWDDTNNFLGIGSSTPGAPLAITTNSANVKEIMIEATGHPANIVMIADGTPVELFHVGYFGISMGGNDLMYLEGNGDMTLAGNIRVNGTGDSSISGSLGIGTTTPNQKLSIYNNGADTAIEFSAASGSNYKWTMGVDYSDGAKFKISSSSALGTNDRFVIDGSGRVGIGTASPGTLLNLSAAAGANELRITNTTNSRSMDMGIDSFGGYLDILNSNDEFHVRVAGTQLLNLKSSKFGIGNVATPGSTLSVNGNAAIGANYAALAAPTNGLIVEGNMGVGTSTPSTKLTAYGTNAQGSFIESATEFLRVGVGETANTSVIGWDDGDSLRLGVYDSPYDTTITDYVTITSAGRMGIGTTTPGEKLYVYDASDSSISLGRAGSPQLEAEWQYNGATMVFGTVGDDDVAFMTNGTARLTVQEATGYVGIGTSTPSTLLTTFGTNVQHSMIESATEFLRTGIGETANTSIIGWDDSDSLQLGVYSSPYDTTISSLMTILSNGNIGIGTTTVPALLTIAGNPSVSDTGVVRIEDNGKAAIQLVDSGNSGTLGSLSFFGRFGGSDLLYAEIDGRNDSVTGGTLRFHTNSGERMRITSTGKVGIGTTTPNSLLSVASTDPYITITDTNASAGSKHLNLRNDGGVFKISTTSDSLSAETTALSYNPSGTAGLGVGTSTPWRTMSIVGTAAITGLSAVAGTDYSVCIDNTTKELTMQSGDSCAVSAARFKHDIEKIEETGLDMIMKLDAVSYYYNEDNTNTKYWGLIADQAASTSPQLAYFNADGSVQTLNTFGFLALFTKSIQELNLNLNAISSSTATTTPASLAFKKSFFERVAEWLGDKANGIKKLYAERIETKRLCVADATGDTTCITKSQLDNLLEQANTPAAVSDPDLTPEPVPPPAPTPTPEPEPEPEPTPEPEPEPTPEPDPVDEGGEEVATE